MSNTKWIWIISQKTRPKTWSHSKNFLPKFFLNLMTTGRVQPNTYPSLGRCLIVIWWYQQGDGFCRGYHPHHSTRKRGGHNALDQIWKGGVMPRETDGCHPPLVELSDRHPSFTPSFKMQCLPAITSCNNHCWELWTPSLPKSRRNLPATYHLLNQKHCPYSCLMSLSVKKNPITIDTMTRKECRADRMSAAWVKGLLRWQPNGCHCYC